MAKGFTFKQFHVDDFGCGMPVSTDGVLLGAWAELSQHGQILDIGTGSGLLALIAAQRTAASAPQIVAIEIDPTAAKAASQNFILSPWSTRLECIEQDVESWAARQPSGSFNTIVCNPPYFNSGLKADCKSRATARHTDSLSHPALLATIRHLLCDTGSANLILPEHEGHQLVKLAPAYQLSCRRLCEVRSTEKKPVSRLLITLSRQPGDRETEQLSIHHQGQYSEQFSALTRDFYLKL
ncbi:SAM-dependent methyltransferase [Photobacterium proteolyticum]|uniref:tRNA1(Val) (adenine(37)-N6)-methyltransferase n=1 Tax=Photobacterium proteolyticum TaxID=1903952 RepID=A0A1Q9GXF4_9GAMM|nr:methyltransferase [Photobacterium proteolyticum]OLQ79945.1 SAM-dependent methyltransferase [Photobacterium proteolyticum]